jgi:hypothetical protein
MHASTEVNMPRASNNLEVVNRPSIKVKGFTQAPMDYISVDLDYKILKETTIASASIDNMPRT